MSYPQALLIAIEPVLKCVIFTEELGPISIQSESTRKLEKPDISSLSFLRIESLASACNRAVIDSLIDSAGEGNDFSEYEILVFPDDNHTAKVDIESNDEDFKSVKHILAEVQELRGLQERLLDASLASTAKSSQGIIEIFLSRSETIVKEFVTTIFQRRQKILRKSSTNATGRSSAKKLKSNHYREGELSNYNRPLRYFESLYEQCSQLEKLLHENEVNQTTRDSNSLDISDDLMKVNIAYFDEGNRSHELVAELQPNFPSVSPTWTTDLPIEFKPLWTGKEQIKVRKVRIEKKKDPSVNNQYGKDNENKSITNTKMLSSVFHYFTHIITKFQSFFNEMDDIDLNLWVLEPSLPSRRSCNERRIALREGLSIHLVFDPEHPRSSPISMRLSGTAKDIQELRNAYQNYVIIATNKNSSCESKNDEEKDGDRRNNNDTSAPLPTITKSITNLDDSRPHQDHHQQQKLEEEDKKKHWTEDLSIRLNLEACFGFSLPSPASTAKEDFVGECGICYSHRLPIGDGGGDENDHHLVNGGTRKKLSLFPSIICSNSSCSRHYHESCLLEWLHSLPNVKVRFDRIHGICPYCCGDISVKFSN